MTILSSEDHLELETDLFIQTSFLLNLLISSFISIIKSSSLVYIPFLSRSSLSYSSLSAWVLGCYNYWSTYGFYGLAKLPPIELTLLPTCRKGLAAYQVAGARVSFWGSYCVLVYSSLECIILSWLFIEASSALSCSANCLLFISIFNFSISSAYLQKDLSFSFSVYFLSFRKSAFTLSS